MTLIDRVRRTLKRHQLATPTTRVCVALSGGPDSMALLHALCAAARRGPAAAGWRRALEPSAPRRGRRRCALLRRCGGLAGASVLARAHRRERVGAGGAPVHRGRGASGRGTPSLNGSSRRNTPTSSRSVIRATTRPRPSCCGWSRGAGTRGLAAMHPRNGIVIRPLLDCSREDVRAFLQQRDLASVHDDVERRCGHSEKSRSARTAAVASQIASTRGLSMRSRPKPELARVDQEFLQRRRTNGRVPHVRSDTQSVWRVDADALRALPPAIGSRVLHELMMRAGSTRSIGFDAVERAWSVVDGTSGGLDAAGHRVERVGPDVVLSSRPAGSAGRRPAVSTHRFRSSAGLSPSPGRSRFLKSAA